MKKTTERTRHNIAEKIALAVAKMSANSACVYALYQPKLPASVKKLRKV